MTTATRGRDSSRSILPRAPGRLGKLTTGQLWMAGHCSPVKLPESTGHPDGNRGQVSERSEAESKRWERSDRVLLERISPNKAKTAPEDTGAPFCSLPFSKRFTLKALLRYAHAGRSRGPILAADAVALHKQIPPSRSISGAPISGAPPVQDLPRLPVCSFRWGGNA